MEKPHFKTNSFDRNRMIGEIVVTLVMLILAFFAIASSDASATSTQLYWALLVVAYAVVAVIDDRLHADHRIKDLKSTARMVLHWIGVLLAIQLVFYFTYAGRVANAEVGLFNALILALGTYLFGVSGNWRFMLIGAALGVTTAGVALVEEYLWFLFAVSVLVVLVLVIGARFRHRG